MADDNLEKLLRQGLPASSRHKEMLKKRLFEDNMELGVDDLAQVAGGVMPEEPKFLDWPDEDTVGKPDADKSIFGGNEHGKQERTQCR